MDSVTHSEASNIEEVKEPHLDFVYGCKILLVDDQLIATDMLEAMFKPLGFDTLAVNNSLLVNEALREFEADLILLDVDMPGKTGFEISTELKASARFHHIPIILLTAMDDKEAVLKGLSCGVQDYVTKPFHKAELTARVINNLRLKKQHDFWRLNHKLINEQFDTSGFPLKATFYQYLEKFVTQSTGQIAMAVFSIYAWDEIVASVKTLDIKNSINASIFERLNQDNNEQRLFGNLENGKFGILFLKIPENISQDLADLQARLEQLMLIADNRIKLKVNVGYCQRRCTNDSWRDLIDQAEIALLQAKQLNSPSIVEYTPQSHDEFNDKWWTLHALEDAICHNELGVHFQPQFDLYTWECTGYEALARWNSKTRGLIYPKKFIPIAEQYGLIDKLSYKIFKQALRSLHDLPAPKVALNVSPQQLRNPAFPLYLTTLLDKHDTRLNQVELELTESSMIDKELIQMVEKLMHIGFNITIDDFGTGYSNLSLLTKLPFSKVKIDRSLIKDIHICKKSEVLVSSIVSFSTKFGMKVLAEGVESTAQAETLRTIGVDEVQGFLFGNPRAIPSR